MQCRGGGSNKIKYFAMTVHNSPPREHRGALHLLHLCQESSAGNIHCSQIGRWIQNEQLRTGSLSFYTNRAVSQKRTEPQHMMQHQWTVEWHGHRLLLVGLPSTCKCPNPTANFQPEHVILLSGLPRKRLLTFGIQNIAYSNPNDFLKVQIYIIKFS